MKYFALVLAVIALSFLTSCESEAPTGKLSVNALPGSYEIIIDNVNTGFSTPHTFILPMGEHVVTVQENGLQFYPPVEEIVIDTSPLAIEFRQIDTVFVDSNPQGATILVDGEETSYLTPASIELPVGEYDISATAENFSTETETVAVMGDGTASVSFELVNLLFGQLTVESTPPGAAIFIDSEPTNEVTPFTFTVTDETHEVSLFLPWYSYPTPQQVTVPTGGNSAVLFDLHELEQSVLIEGFSNVSCVGCGESNETIHHLLTTPGYENVALIKYATNWPASNDPHYLANTSDNMDQLNFYQPTHLPTWGIPTVIVDGLISGGPGEPLGLAELTALVDQQIALTPQFEIKVDADFSENSIPIIVTLISSTDIPANSDAKLKIALCENPISYEEPPGSEGETEFHWIMREFEVVEELPFPLSAGNRVEFMVQFTSNSEWITENMIAVAFVQDDSQIDSEQRSVLQTGFSTSPALLNNNTNASFERGSK